ncbi:tripartite tricarboxylate transporter permease [Zwartia vadi]|uniref:tripartite tricarboxylate transporter permease n=1 Tax=Zwartia vadi TaxID=3058168 RepID=UPI0025B56EF5|nr:tripartite tricarboxylate transporter permease [Zwartia vadi]MDN3987743.1 tripartite tricarboxylate transporter permease [Zwartia vadi]
MDPLSGLFHGLSVVFSFQNLLAAFFGALAGTALGVLPGLGPVAGVAILLPITFTLPPTAGLIMMAGIYYGAQYGGSTTAILVNMPGESSSVVTCIDGYKLTQRGRAGGVLSIVAIGSFIGGTVSVIGVMLFSPTLAQLGILFGPAEFFALTAGGLLLLSRISGGSFAAGILPMALGMVLSTVGEEAVTAMNRFTFGFNDLSQGFDLVPLVVGLYGVTEIMFLVERIKSQPLPVPVGLRDMLPTREELRRSWAPYGRGTIVGFIFGLLPGPSATLSSFASYRLEKGVSKHRDEIGEGAIEGVAGPETANNAAATSSMVPLLSLGMPFGAITALMMAAMMVYGVQPGPLLMTDHPEIFWGVIASMLIGNVMLLALNIPMISVWVSLLRIPSHILLTMILLVAVIGSYSVRNSILDVYVLFFIGLIGYVFRKLDFQLAPLVVGVVLGPLIEKHMREALFMSRGDLLVYVSSPIAIGIWILVLLVMVPQIKDSLLRKLFIGNKGIE